jgi:hypothetical protein
MVAACWAWLLWTWPERKEHKETSISVGPGRTVFVDTLDLAKNLGLQPHPAMKLVV